MHKYPYPCELYEAGCIYSPCNGLADVPDIAYPTEDDTVVYYPRCYKQQTPQILSAISEKEFARAMRGEFSHQERVPLGKAPTDARVPSVATKADLRAAVKTILRGEDISAAKPGPRLTAAKRRQIEAAEAYRKSHAGCTLHNACIKSFVAAKGGYKSAKVMYEYLRLQQDSKSSKN